MWIKVAFISRSRHRALEPLDRSVEIALLDQVRADVVVRVAEVGINFDRAMAFFNRLVREAHEAVSPSEKRMRFGSRVSRNRLLVEIDGFIQVAAHLRFIGRLKKPERFALC